MVAESVDISDQAAVSAWMEAFNSRPFEERDRILGELPGFGQILAGAGEDDRLDSSDRPFAFADVCLSAGRGTVRGIDAEALSRPIQMNGAS